MIRTAVGLFALLVPAAAVLAQTTPGYKYVYDDSGRLITAIDATGNLIAYTYDAANNIVSITRGGAPSAGQLAILNFTPQTGAIGSTVTIQGQNFSTTAASNAVTFNGVAATVVSATATSLTVTVPTTATTGPVSVMVGGVTATSTGNFTVVSSPSVLSVSPPFAVSSTAVSTISNFTVTGANLTGATFSFAPAFTPPSIVVNSATINSGGTSATLNLSVAANVKGSFTLLATNAAGSSSPIASTANTFQIIDPNGDADGDGLTNAVEIAIGTNPLVVSTAGNGLPDGWQVFFGLNPLSASSAGPDPGKSGDTALQDFQQNLSPVNPNRVPPAVIQVTPANGATGIYINSVVVVRFGEPLQAGVSLIQAQNAITAALGSNSSVSASSQAIAVTTLQSYMNRTCCGNSVIPGVVTVTGPYGAVSGGVTASSDGLSVVFAPSVPLTSNSTYTVRVNGVRDSAGNLMTTAFTSTFTTGATVDTSVPTIKLVDPENNSTNVPTNAHYTVQFSKAMDPSTLTSSTFSITDQITNAEIAGLIQVDATGMTASFIPNSPLPVGRTFTVTFSTGIKDTVGNTLASNSSYIFTTGYTPEIAAPQLVASSPVSGATGIPVNAIVDLEFSQPLNITTVVPNIQVSTGGSPIAVQVALSGGDERVTITPVSGLQPNVQYTVAVGAGIQNIAGTGISNPGSFNFQSAAVVDKTTLTIIAEDPANSSTGVPLNGQVRLGFNKPVDVVSLTASNVNVYPNSVGSGSPVAGNLTASSNQTSVTFTPTSNLLPETQYCVSINGLVDLEDQAMSGSGTFFCFTTGNTSQTTAPVVTQVSPGNGTTGVPVNATIQVSLSEPVSSVSVGTAGITVAAGGTPIAGSVAVGSGATRLTFTPASSLAVSTAYTVAVGGFTDLAGNPVTAFTSGFTTSSSSAALTTGPTVVSVSPANSATGVAVTAPEVVTFSAPVNPLTISSSTMQISANGIVVGGTYSVSANGTAVTFTPVSPLPGSATVTIYESGIQDPAGNNASASNTTFTTAATLDTTAPTVVSVTPSSGQTGVGLNGQVVVVFSKSMNPSTLSSSSTVSLLAADARQSFNLSVSADNRTMVLSGLSLPASTVLTLAISGATDLSGNALANFTSQFTTASAFDTTHATVVNQRPATGATGVSINASPVVLFVNKTLNASTLSSAVQVTQNGQLVSGTVALAGNGEAIEFTPSSPWTYGALVQVFLDPAALDTDGNAVNAYKGTFTTIGSPATAQSTLVNYSPANGATAVPLNVIPDAIFSEPLSAATVIAANVSLSGPSGTVTSTPSLDPTGTIVHLTPNAPLTVSSQYCFYLQNLMGTGGVAAQNLGYCFTTGTNSQTTAPTIVTVSPANNLTNVPVNANVSVVFSGPVDPATISGTTVSLSGGGATSMPASISFSSNNQKVEITPEAPLPASTVMTLAISNVMDAAGNAVTPQTTHFTTGTAAATANVGVIAANPAPSATGVPVNAAISLRSTAEIDLTSVSTSSFQVYDQTLGQTIPGTYSLSADGMTVYFVPTLPLAAGRSFTVYFNSQGMTDLAGNPLQASCSGCLNNYSFTTGFAASATAPIVTGFSPANGLTGVPLNAQMVVGFSEPVNGESLSGVTLATGGNAVALNSSLGSGNQILTITPAAGLLPNTTYTLSVTGVTDFSGNVLAGPFTSSFTTGSAPDLTTLTVVAVDPANSTTGVPLNALIRVGFSKGVDIVAGGGVLVYPYTSGSSYPIPGSLSVSTSGKNVTFTSSSLLQAETVYCVYVSGVVDLEGNPLSGTSTTCFTTGSTSQTTAPVVTEVSPGNGATGVPVNAPIEIGLSEPVSAVSVGSTGIAVAAGGTPVAGTVSVGSGATTVTFTPSSPLAVSTAYTVTLGGITDLTGNPVTPFTSSFTTSSSSTPVKTGPTPVSVSPVNSATGVSVGTPITVTYSAAIDPLTVNTNSMEVRLPNGDAVAGSYSVSANGTAVTFTPVSPLPGSTVISVNASYFAALQDVAGNSASASNTTFTTAATLDTTAPTVVSVTPSSGQTGVGLNGQVVVVFSKSMNPSTLSSSSTVSLLAADARQSFNLSVSADNRTMVLSGLSLPASTVLTLAISGATDLSGNALANFTSQFTTASAFDTTHATVVNQRPATGATGVSINASPVVLFVNKTLNASTVTNAVNVSQNGQLVTGTVSVVGNGQTIVFTPTSPWTYGAQVQVFLTNAALDTDGNAVNAYKGTFTITGSPATTQSTLVNYSPANGATAVPLNITPDAIYSEPLSAATVIAANVSLSGPSGTVTSTPSLDPTGTIVHLTPNAPLTVSSQYCFYLQNLMGTGGVAAQNLGYCFTTGTSSQTTAPTIVTVSPANNLTNVPVNANVSVVFSGPVDPATVSGTTIALSGGGATSMPASISFSSNNQKVEITPEAPLPASTVMTLAISNVMDAAGNAVTPQTTHFTTGTAAATANVGVIAANPAPSATGVPVNAAISLRSTAEIDLTSVSTSSFQVYDQTLGQTIPGTYSLSANGMTVYFVPTTQLSTGRTYSVTFNNQGMTDLAGNPLQASCSGCLNNYNFTTGFAANSTPPVVAGISPANGLTGVPLNAQMVVGFSEPVNGESLSGVTLATGGNAVALNSSLGSGNQILTITPAAGLLPNTTYTLSVTGVTDFSGNVLAGPFTSSFTTGSAPDLTTLTVVAVDPANSTTGVPLNALIRVGFSKGVDIVAGGGVLVYPYTSGSSYPIPGSLSVSTSGKNVTFTSSSLLQAETVYCVYVSGVVDLEGNPLSGTSTTCFTTGSASQTTAPVVTEVSPGNGATGVPVNAPIEIGLSEPVSAVSVGSTGIAVAAGGTPVAGTVSVGSGATTVTFTPSSPLAVSTAYTVTLGGITDLTGNPVTPFTSSFTTSSSSTPVKTGPTPVSVSPANSATGVSVGTPITVTYSAAIDPLTVNTNSMEVRLPNGDAVAGSYSVSANGTAVTFTPVSPLPGSTVISVNASYFAALQDVAGNNASASNTTFTTAATLDTTAPTVVSVTPSSGQTGVGLNGQVVVVFSKSMNPSTLSSSSTVSLLAADARQSFNLSVSADNRTMVLSGLSLPASTVLTLAISGATDLSGNALANFTSQFTTASAFDTTHATVVNQRPATGATGVSINASPVVLFVNKTLNASTVTNAVNVSQNGQLVAGTVSVVGNGQTIVFTPTSPWTYGAQVQVFLTSAALDTDGNAVNGYSGTFTITGNPASTAATLVNYSPANGATGVPLNIIPDAIYSEPLSAATAIAANVSLNGPSAAVASTLSLDPTGTIIHLTPNSPLTASTQYCFYLYNLKGTGGVAAQNVGYCFTTGTSSQTTAPTIATVSPANSLTNVPVNANVSVVFSGPVDPATISGTTVSLSGGGVTSMPASISFSSNNQKVEITPEAPLPASTVMTLAISGVTDVAGNAVTPQTTHFTTGTAAATVNPGVIAANPAASATGVPVNAAISLETNAAIDGTTVNTSTFQVYDQTLGQTIPGTYSLSANGMTVYFVPTTQFSTGRTYTVYFNNQGMADLAGNPLQASCSGCLNNYSFTTGFAASATAPIVTGFSPANGLTGVPLNAQMVVGFSEPVNGESLSGVTLATGGNAVALNSSLGSGNQILTITPAAGLLPNTTYTLSVTGVTDFSGNVLAGPFTSSFTTGSAPDLTTLTVVAVDPANSTTGVPLNALIRVGFSKPLNTVSATGSAIELYPYYSSSLSIPGSVSISANGTNVIFTPFSPLEVETQYCVYVSGVVDLEGNPLSGSSTTCFTTGSASQTTAPVVTEVSPGNGATGVPVNAPIEIGLSEPVSAVSVGSTGIAVAAGGTPVAGTVSVGSGATTVTFTPSSPLAVSTAYTVTLGGITDLTGNPVTPFTSSFTTSSSSTPVKTGPTPVSVSPANSATGVSVGTPITVTYSAAIDPLTVNTNSMEVRLPNGDAVAGSYSVSANGTAVTFTPVSPLPGSTVISVNASYFAALQDVAGNNASASNTTFTTAATLDTTAPTVVSVTPSSGQTGVGLNGQVVVVFSKSMNPSTLSSSSTVSLLAADARQSFNLSVSADNRTMVLSGLSLPASTVLTLAISGATDLSGNALANFTSQFTTASAFDTTHATVVNQRPATGATGVSINASPVVLFVNKTLNASTVTNAVNVSQNGQLVAGTVSVVGNGQTIVFTPTSPWTYGALVQVFLTNAALDTDGNAVNAYNGTFTTIGSPATTAATLVNYSPANGATAVPLNAVVDAIYNEPLNATTVIAANVYLNGPSAAVPSTLSLDPTGTIVHLKPNSPLATSTQYCFYLQNLKGTNGLAAQNLGYCFTTGGNSQTTAPAVVTISPPNNLANVPVNAKIGIVFSGPIDPITLNASTVFVSGGGIAPLAASISFSSNNQKVEITPEAPLPASTVMSLTISGVTDVAGNAVAAQTTHFTTGTAAATANVGVLIANPSAAETGVPTNAALSLQTNAEIDGTSVNTSSYEVYDTILSQTIAGTYSLSANGMTVYFVPNALLATGRTYQVYFNNQGMTDVAGNPLGASCSGCLNNYSFITGTATSTSAPQVLGVSPVSALTSVPINAQIVVSFNEPVNGESLGAITLSTGGNAVTLNSSLGSGNQILTITPAAALLPAATYTLSVAGVSDLSGNTMATPFTSTFTAGSAPDLTTATVSSVVPANSATGVLTTAPIQVQFSKMMDVLTLTTQTVTITNGSTVVPATLTFNANGTMMTITPTSALSTSTAYTLQVTSGALDLEGGALTAFKSTFTTGTL